MLKRFLTILLFLPTLLLSAQTTTFETATEAVANMKVGWNLGNTLDAHNKNVSDPTASETLRGQSVTKPELMQMMKEAGFGAIRVPVTWYPHMATDGTVDAAWMARVKAVVDYVISQGMYCIINVHHDGNPTTSTTTSPWLRATMDNYNANHERFENLWTQIANAFKNYGELLIFEGYNELLDANNSWNYASFASNEDKYDATVAADAYAAINAYAQSFVSAVRATGGNNAQRNLIIKTYASCGARGTWSTHLTEPFTQLQIPTDPAQNHLIAGVHAYPRIAETDGTARTSSAIAAELNAQFSNLTNILAAKGTPVVITEWSSSNVDATTSDYDAIRSHFLNFAADFVSRCKQAGIAPFYWMGLSDKTHRTMPAMTQPDLAYTIVNSYYEGTYEPFLPLETDYGLNYVVNYTAQYGEIRLLNNDGSTKYDQVQITFKTPPGAGKLQFKKYSSSGSTANVTIGGGRLFYSYTVDAATTPQVSMQWRTTTFSPVTITSLKLRKADDGTYVDAIPTAMHHSGIESIAAPTYVKTPIGAAHYASLYYNDQALVVPERISAETFKVENGNLVSVKTYATGDVIPAATGVILSTGEREGYYIFRHTDLPGEAPTGSMLLGSDAAATTTGPDATATYKFYKLSTNLAGDPTTVGFYFGATAGGAFTNGAHKAYLAVPTASASATRYFFSDAIADDIATGLSSVLPEETKRFWYTLDGRALNAPPTAPGIYILGGKKVLVK